MSDKIIEINEIPNSSFMMRDIVFSKEFRRIQDKTQMFNTRISEHFRTRMTHSIEVLTISEELCNGISKIMKNYDIDYTIDLNIVKSIAYAHDIGHTPYGHAGEEIINELICENNLFFKHNINSAKILLDPKGKLSDSNNEYHYLKYDWKLFDGIIKHTKPFPKKCETVEHKDPYNLLRYFKLHPVWGNENFLNEVTNFIDKFNCKQIENICESSINKYLNFIPALSLEGQIVSLADEISQRISDFDDSIRLYHKMDDKGKSKYKKLLEDLSNKLFKIEQSLEKILDIYNTKEDLINKYVSNDEIPNLNEEDIFINSLIFNIDYQYEYLGEDGKKHNLVKTIPSALRNACRVICKSIKKILDCEDSINEESKKISKQIHDLLIKNTLLYVEYFFKNNKFQTHTLKLKYTNNRNELTNNEYLVAPILDINKKEIDSYKNGDFKECIELYRKKSYCQFISFPELLEFTFIYMFSCFNKAVIDDEIIKSSNEEGRKNIQALFNIYKKNIKLIDTNSKRQLIFMFNSIIDDYSKDGNIKKNDFSSIFSKIVLKYNEDKNDIPEIEQVILEGISRMTDTYVEALLEKYRGYMHYKYNIDKF